MVPLPYKVVHSYGNTQLRPRLSHQKVPYKFVILYSVHPIRKGHIVMIRLIRTGRDLAHWFISDTQEKGISQ